MEELKLKLWFVCGLVFLTGAGGVAVGDWDPGDGYKMHFPQVPDPCGWDICVRHQYVADDWVCDETGPVTDIHFWTSWKADTVGFFMGWDIYIFDHDPQTGEPNTVVWSLGGIGYDYYERPAGSGEQGWFCPSEGIPYPDDHTEFYQINITDIDAPFVQQEGRRYWLVVGSPLTDRPVGWKTSQDHFGMTALWTLYATDWNPVEPEGEPQDLAFVITGGYPPILGACCLDGECLLTTEDDCNTLGGVYLGDATTCYPPLGNPSIYEADPGLPIPDNDPLGVSDTITVPDSFILADVDVDVIIDHTYIGDLIIKVEHLGTTVTLWNRACVFPDDIDAVFDDEGNDVVCTSPTVGNITPSSTFGDALSAFDGMDSAGDWTITVSDNGHDDTGTLLHWSVHLDEPGPDPCPKSPVPNLKWSQPPIEIDPNAQVPTYCGWDQTSLTIDPCDYWGAVADDFRCLGTMPVSSVHWWGSHIGWSEPYLPPTQASSWRIGFWSNVPASADPDPNYSRPDILLWQVEVDAGRVTCEWVGNDWFPDMMIPEACFQYYVQFEPEEYFQQADFEADTQDNVFWISIVAVYSPPGSGQYPWGWKTRPWSWMDDAVVFEHWGPLEPGVEVDPGLVAAIEYEGESYDVAFELETDANYIKWEQPFTGIRRWPHYEDELSIGGTEPTGEPNVIRLVADDWRCERRTPVTAAVWWGSYLGYSYQACAGEPCEPPVRPDYFLLQIWDDVPDPSPGDPQTLSHPNNVLWGYQAYDYDEVLVGYDKHPEGEGAPNEPVFRYSVRLPQEDWFFQRDVNGMYWFSVLAVYDGNAPSHDWGWTNHKHMFNDNAVTGTLQPGTMDEWIWDKIHDQTGAPADMSFILFTDPNECTNCADYNTDSIVNFPDYAEFADDWGWTGPAGGYNSSDLNCDGLVDFADVKILADQWLDSCP
ncbi:MAG: DUF7901 domain-containing protein [Planctomycetota bacterium]